MTLHFAYGSNMSRAHMSRRCPTAVAVGAARLDGWRYIVTGDGYASIVPAHGSVVHGVLWRLRPRDLAALIAYESLGSGLYRRRLLPVRQNARTRRALTFIGRNRHEGRARPGYQDHVVLPSARAWNLPAAYLAELARWVPGGWRSAARREPGDRQ